MNDKRRTAVSFALGVLFGAALIGAGSHYYFARCRKDCGGSHWKDRGKEFLSEMKSKLSLTPDQEAKIDKILEAKRKKIDEMRQKVRPNFHKVREQTHAEIRSVLKPDQQRVFDQIVLERKKRWEEREKLREAGDVRKK